MTHEKNPVPDAAGSSATSSEARAISASEEAATSSGGAEDKRLERLYDYTKFHIGIYLSAAGGLVALGSNAPRYTSAATMVRIVGEDDGRVSRS